MNNKYWEEDIETMSREKLQELQLQRLKKTISIAANSPYYKKVFQEHNITADSIQNLKDIRKIPFTTKADMRATYPFGLVSGNMQEDGVRIHSSSGTTGTPTLIVHSQHDLDSWANLVARCLYMVGIRKTDVFQNSSGYGMFTGGLGFQYGAERQFLLLPETVSDRLNSLLISKQLRFMLFPAMLFAWQKSFKKKV